MLRYNGSAWVNQATAAYPVLNTMTGDNSDTTLTLTRAPLHENAVQVYWDGVYQHKDNWAVSGTTLTFATAPPTGVKVEAVTGSQTNMLYGHDVTVDKMTGDNSDTTLTLSVTPSNENHTNIFFDGVYQSKDNYTVSGTTVTFSTAPPTGVLVEAMSNQAVAVGTATGIAASAVTGLTEVTAADADHVMIYDASGSALKKSLVSDLVQTSEEIADIVGAMVSSNTESGITVAYQDGDNTLDFTVGTLNQDTTGLAGTATALATARTIGGTSFDGTANIAVATATEGTNVTVSANNSTDETVYPTFVDGATGTQGIETDTGLTYNPSTGVITATQFTGNVTGNVTGNASGTAATVTTAAQTNITSLGTLTGLTGGTGDFNWDSNTLVVDSSASMVGIGTSSPGGLLETYNGTDNTKHWRIHRPGTAEFGIGVAGSYLHISDSSSMPSGSSKGIYMKFNTGEVGIGVPVPTTHFSVAKSANITQVALTSSSAAVAWDAKAAANAYHLTTENTTFSAPSNAVEGAIISVEIAQGGTARTIAWNTVFEFAASTAPTITATASKTDILSFRYNGSVWQEIGRVQNMAQT